MPETWYCPAIVGFSSVFSLTNFALPAFATATFSTIGPSMRHGPHHGAQKSTRTGWLLCNTSASKLVCVTSANALMSFLTLLKLGLLRLAGDLGDLRGLLSKVRNRDNLFAVAQPLQAHALGIAPRLTDVAHLQANDLVAGRDHQHLVVGRDENLVDDLPDVVALARERLHSLAPARRVAVLFDGRPFAEGERRHQQDFPALVFHDVHRDDRVAFVDRHRLDAPGRPAHRADVLLVKMHRHPARRGQDDVAGAVGKVDRQELVARIEIDCQEPVAPDVGELFELRLLDDAVPSDHDEVLLALELVDRKCRGHLFAGREGQQIDQRRAASLPRRIGDLVPSQAIDAAFIGEEEDVVVRLGDEEVAYHVLALEVRDAGYAAAAAALRSERIQGDALDITADRIGDDDVDVRRERLDRYLVFGRLDGGAPLVAEALLDVERLAPDDLRDAPRAPQDVFQLRNRFDQLGVFILDLLALQANEGAQAHIDDRLCLKLAQLEAHRQSLLGFIGRLASANDLDDFIDIVERDAVAFEKVRALLRFAKIVGRSRNDDVLAVRDEMLEQLSEAEHLRLDRRRAVGSRTSRYERQHVEAERRLQRGVFEELIEHDLRRRVLG